MNRLAVTAIVFFAVHLAYHVHLGDPANALWACHMASLLIGIGGLLGWSNFVGTGALWLAIGIPLWFYHLAVGGPLVPTSLLTHFGAAIVAGLLLKQMGTPRGIAWQAAIGLAGLMLITRLVTSRADNVNLAFDIHGRTTTTPSQHALYLLAMAVVVIAVFAASEFVLRRVFPQP